MKLLALTTAFFTLIWGVPAQAEPYLALRTGQKCMSCHVNPTGGGKRSDAGSIYGQHVLAGKSAATAWNGRVSPYLALGADLRANASYLKRHTGNNQSAFETQHASVYFEINAVENLLTIYIDEQLSPNAINREAYALLWNGERSLYLKAGRLFLPYGLRLEDDTAFIRSVSGINFANADNGIEGGYESEPWSINTTLSNGTNGGEENNLGKQLSFRVAHIRANWRAGASININDSVDIVERNMLNIFGGLQALGIDWLFEIDSIKDRGTPAGTIDSLVGFVEANYQLTKGQNLKLSLEYYDPDDRVSENQQTRSSLVWEYTPVSLLQFRVGVRFADGIPQATDNQNDDLMFAQLHAWF